MSKAKLRPWRTKQEWAEKRRVWYLDHKKKLAGEEWPCTVCKKPVQLTASTVQTYKLRIQRYTYCKAHRRLVSIQWNHGGHTMPSSEPLNVFKVVGGIRE